MAYVTVTEAKLYMGIPGDEGGDDALIAMLIDRAQQYYEDFSDNIFDAGTNTNRAFDADKDVDDLGQILYFDRWLVSINSITNGDGTAVTGAQYTTLPPRNAPYYGIKIKDSQTITWEYDSNDDPENAITVNGAWGVMATPDAAVKADILYLVHWLYRQKDASIEADRVVIVGDGTVLVPQGFPAMVADRARRWRMPTVT